MKKVDEALVTHLTHVEIKALLDAPDPRTPSGTRDGPYAAAITQDPAADLQCRFHQ